MKTPRYRSLKQAVDAFAAEMLEKLRQKKIDGWRGWCDAGNVPGLRRALVAHVATGDPIDVANYCMFLWNLNQPTMPTSEEAAT